jgi:hypothetical protein
MLKHGMKMQWRTIWRSKHQVPEQIEEILVFWKTWMFQFAKPDSPVFSRCTV